MQQLTYRIILTPEPEGGFTVTVPALQGCVTFGKTLDEAISMAKEAISGFLEVLQDIGEPLPDDSRSLEYSITLPFNTSDAKAPFANA